MRCSLASPDLEHGAQVKMFPESHTKIIPEVKLKEKTAYRLAIGDNEAPIAVLLEDP